MKLYNLNLLKIGDMCQTKNDEKIVCIGYSDPIRHIYSKTDKVGYYIYRNCLCLGVDFLKDGLIIHKVSYPLRETKRIQRDGIFTFPIGKTQSDDLPMVLYNNGMISSYIPNTNEAIIWGVNSYPLVKKKCKIEEFMKNSGSKVRMVVGKDVACKTIRNTVIGLYIPWDKEKHDIKHDIALSYEELLTKARKNTLLSYLSIYHTMVIMSKMLIDMGYDGDVIKLIDRHYR